MSVKKFLKSQFLLLLSIVMLMMNGCVFGSLILFSDLDNLTPIIDSKAEVKNLTVEIGDGKLTLKWKNPNLENFEKTVITYTTSADEETIIDTIELDKDVFAAGALCEKEIDSLTNDTEYVFSLKTVCLVDKNPEDPSEGKIEQESEIKTIKATPKDFTGPADVENFVATAGDGKITLSWNEPLDLDLVSYELTWTPAHGPKKGKVSLIKGTVTYIVDGLTNGTEYTFTIKALDSEKNSSVGIEVKGTPVASPVADVTPPGKVTNLSMAEGDGQVQLIWEDPVDDDLAEIKISWTSLSGDGSDTVANGVEVYTATGLVNDVEYTFSVTTVDINGNENSSAVTIKATPTAPVTPPSDTAPPAEVTNLLVTPSDGGVRFSWTNPIDVDFAKVIISWTPSADNVTVESPASSCIVEGLTNGTLYTFTIKTVDTTGNASTGQTITETPVDTTAPGAVSNLSAIPGDGEVSLNWDLPADLDIASIKISYEKTSEPSVEVGSENLLATATSVTISSLENDEEYKFSVIVKDTSNNESSVEEVTATPTGTPAP